MKYGFLVYGSYFSFVRIEKYEVRKPEKTGFYRKQSIYFRFRPQVVELYSGVEPLQIQRELRVKSVGDRIKVEELMNCNCGVDLQLGRVRVLVQF